jgi:hypothetical protein
VSSGSAHCYGYATRLRQRSQSLGRLVKFAAVPQVISNDRMRRGRLPTVAAEIVREEADPHAIHVVRKSPECLGSFYSVPAFFVLHLLSTIFPETKARGLVVLSYRLLPYQAEHEAEKSQAIPNACVNLELRLSKREKRILCAYPLLFSHLTLFFASVLLQVPVYCNISFSNGLVTGNGVVNGDLS